MPSRIRVKSRGAALAAAFAFIVLAFGLAPPAHAASSIGTHACGANYGWLTSNMPSGGGKSTPPGSVYVYVHTSGGIYTTSAAYSNGAPKAGGGQWITSPRTSSWGTPFCRNYA